MTHSDDAQVRTVGLFFQHDRERSVEIARQIEAADYGSLSLRFIIGEDAKRRGFLEHPGVDICGARDFSGMEFAISIGGDGTFLRTARAIRALGIPLFGINTGRLGFLASGNPASAACDTRRILNRDCRLMARIPLQCDLLRGGRPVESIYALNEVTVTKGPMSRPIDMNVSVGGHRLYRLLADGIIVSTPTGSTAYALSAGGPIVHPDVKCLLVVPICPHSLYPRPVILGEAEAIEIEPAGASGEMFLSGDSQLNLDLSHGDRVRVMLDRERPVNVIKLDDSTYYDVLQSKLNWGWGTLDD